MKSKLRKINIGDKQYSYTICDKFSNGKSILTLRVFSPGHKAYPLNIRFSTWCTHQTLAKPLAFGFGLLNANTRQIETVTIHRPKYVRELILQALKQGWAANKADVADGIDLLNAIGFEANILRPIEPVT